MSHQDLAQEQQAENIFDDTFDNDHLLGLDDDDDNLNLEELEENLTGDVVNEPIKPTNPEDARIFSACQELATTYPKRFRRTVSPAEDERQRALNSPAIIRSDFLNYLKTQFPYNQNWVHPTTKIIYDCQYIKDTLQEYKYYSPGFYRALWALWTTQATRAFISENFNYSGSTIRRRWDKGIDTILLMLLFPSLKVNEFKLFSRDS